MKVKVDIWSNVNGWFWLIETRNWVLEGGRCYRSAKQARRSARAVCARFGLQPTFTPEGE